MRKTNQAGYLMRHRGWWVLRYRERVGVGGKIETVQRAKRLVPVSMRSTRQRQAFETSLSGNLNR